MTDPVKPRRRYRSATRTDQAAATRDAVIKAARKLFLEAGWAGTTIAGIARAAKVSPETIYAVFGGKAPLFAEVVRTGVRPEHVVLEDQIRPIARSRQPRHQRLGGLVVGDRNRKVDVSREPRLTPDGHRKPADQCPGDVLGVQARADVGQDTEEPARLAARRGIDRAGAVRRVVVRRRAPDRRGGGRPRAPHP